MSDVPPSYPNEIMAKVFSSGFYSSSFAPVNGTERVLDIGCGAGNNLVYFLNKGCDGIGVDVTDDMVSFAVDNLKRLGHNNVSVKLGSNSSIPFSDNFFDIILSVNTLRYSSGSTGIKDSLQEFSRVTEAGGKAFIMTADPKHEIVMKSKRLGAFDWEVVDFGFRTGDRLSFFDDKAHFKKTLSEYFKTVQVGRTTEEYSTVTLNFLFAICTN